MRVCCLVAVVFVLTLAAGPVRADGLIYNLPKDGTWVSYQVEVRMVTDGKTNTWTNSTDKFRLASVGEVVEDGQKCRWIEIAWNAMVTKADTAVREKHVIKVLIPEKSLMKGESPLDHLIRAWKTFSPGTAQTRAPTKVELRDPMGAIGTPMVMLLALAGPLKDAKPLPKAEVESKLGRLQCEGVTGTVELNRAVGAPMRWVMENRLHPDAPFGVVSGRWKSGLVTADGAQNRGIEYTLKVTDFGDKAVSEMPDAK